MVVVSFESSSGVTFVLENPVFTCDSPGVWLIHARRIWEEKWQNPDAAIAAVSGCTTIVGNLCDRDVVGEGAVVVAMETVVVVTQTST